jgi:hypothetical protein
MVQRVAQVLLELELLEQLESGRKAQLAQLEQRFLLKLTDSLVLAHGQNQQAQSKFSLRLLLVVAGVVQA